MADTTACNCPMFRDTGGFRIADLTCPVHGIGGTEPGDGPWDVEPSAAPPDEDAGLVEKCVRAAYTYGRAWERFEAHVNWETKPGNAWPGERQRLWDAMNAALDELNRERSVLAPAIREQVARSLVAEILAFETWDYIAQLLIIHGDCGHEFTGATCDRCFAAVDRQCNAARGYLKRFYTIPGSTDAD